MPQTMLRYRAASAFGRFHIPDLILGIQSVEENEVIDADVEVIQQPAAQSVADDLNQKLAATKTEPEQVQDDFDDFLD